MVISKSNLKGNRTWYEATIQRGASYFFYLQSGPFKVLQAVISEKKHIIVKNILNKSRFWEEEKR